MRRPHASVAAAWRVYFAPLRQVGVETAVLPRMFALTGASGGANCICGDVAWVSQIGPAGVGVTQSLLPGFVFPCKKAPAEPGGDCFIYIF